MVLRFFSWIDYTVFSITTALGCLIGVYFGFYKKQDNVKSYLNDDKQIKWFPITISLVSSVLAGLTLLGYPTEVYMYGTQISVLVLSVLISGWINYLVFLPVFFKLQLSSIYEYLELRYNKSIKNVFAVIYILKTIFFLPILIYTPSLMFSQVSGLNFNTIAPIMILTCIFYTVVGGIKAVIWVDTLQFAVTLLTLAVVTTMGLISIGGFQNIFNRVDAGDRLEFFNFSLDPTVRTTFWTAVIGHTFTWTGAVSISASEVQRFVMLSSIKTVKKTLIIFTAVTIAIKLVCFLLGAIIYAKYYDCDPKSIGEITEFDQIVPYFITEVIRGLKGLNGLFVAAYFGAAFSAYSTALNTVASVLYTDFLRLCISNNRFQGKQTGILKIITFIIGLSSIGMIYLVKQLGTVFEIMYYVKGITGGATVGIFLLGLVFPFANVKGAITGCVASVVFMSVIIIKTQIYIWNGVIKEHPKPFHTYGCNVTNYSSIVTSVPSFSTSPLPNIYKKEEPFWLFRISFQYYYLIGTMTFIFVGVIVSWFTRKKTDEDVNPSLISPFIKKLRKNARKNEIEAEPLQKATVENNKK